MQKDPLRAPTSSALFDQGAFIYQIFPLRLRYPASWLPLLDIRILFPRFVILSLRKAFTH